jgi:hypothetical protein
VGYGGVIVHWDGAIWTRVSSPTTMSLYAVNMVSPTDGWAGVMPASFCIGTATLDAQFWPYLYLAELDINVVC